MIRIFVFGSNEAGIHGKGAALYALKHHGAKYGNPEGPQGYSYAIPTKDRSIETLPLDRIEAYVEDFLDYARSNSGVQFDLTPIGCGLAGYKREQIKPFFKDKPDNVHFTKEWFD